MEKKQFIERLQINNVLQPKRCTYSFLQKNNLLPILNSLCPEEFGTISERIKHIKYGGGFCLICSSRTSVDVTGKGFAKYCKEHFHHAKRGRTAHNRFNITKDQLIQHYECEKLTLLEISKLYGVSNTTIKNKFVKFNICLRKHADTQKMKSRRNYNAPRIKIDRSELITKYRDEKIPIQNLAEYYKCHNETIRRFLIQEGVERTNRRSSIEWRIIDILKRHNIDYQTDCKTLIPPYDIDVFLPQYSIGIEINGLYTHSQFTGKKDKAYHNRKYHLAQEQGIKLLQFWENDINDPQKIEIIEQMILNRCGAINQKINARQCTINDIDYKSLTLFCNENHIQGAPSKNTKGVGLFYNKKLISVIGYQTFNNTHYIIRFCSQKNICVRGGFSKLLSSLKGLIITYSSNDISDGDLYHKTGFVNTKETKTDMWYTDYKRLYNRQKFMKNKLEKLLEQFDPSLTETENMICNGYDIIYKSGTKTWVKNNINTYKG